jgi:small-conductance mechanosensitive channel
MLVKNYNLPSSEHSLAVEIKVAPGADLERVEEVTRQAATEIQRSVPGAVRDFHPGVVFRSFGDSGVVLAVNLRVRDYRDRGPVVHELIKLVHRRYEEGGIEISVAPRHVVPTTAARPAMPPPV